MALESDVLTKTNHKNKYKMPNFERFIDNIRNNISSNDALYVVLGQHHRPEVRVQSDKVNKGAELLRLHLFWMQLDW